MVVVSIALPSITGTFSSIVARGPLNARPISGQRFCLVEARHEKSPKLTAICDARNLWPSLHSHCEGPRATGHTIIIIAG